MNIEREEYYRDLQDLQDLQDKCMRCMHYHITITLTDGKVIDGIIHNVDNERIGMLVGEDVMELENENQGQQQRQYNNYNNNYGRPRRRFRRFVPQTFPLATIAALSLLPYPYLYQPPFPYYYPYYPF